MALPASFWQKFGTLAQMAQASVALLGFIAVLFQINEIRSNSREAGARQVEGARIAVAENGGGFLGVEEAATVVTVLERAA